MLPRGPRTSLSPLDLPQGCQYAVYDPYTLLCYISKLYTCLLLTMRARSWPGAFVNLYSWAVSYMFSSVQLFSCVRFYGLHYTGLPCPSPTPGAYSNSCPSSQWCHLTISSSVIPFSSCLQSFPASGSFPMNQFFASGGHSIGASASASVLPMNIQDWFPLGWTGWISLQSKGLSRVFSNTTVQKHQCFCTQLSL